MFCYLLLCRLVKPRYTAKNNVFVRESSGLTITPAFISQKSYWLLPSFFSNVGSVRDRNTLCWNLSWSRNGCVHKCPCGLRKKSVSCICNQWNIFNLNYSAFRSILTTSSYEMNSLLRLNAVALKIICGYILSIRTLKINYPACPNIFIHCIDHETMILSTCLTSHKSFLLKKMSPQSLRDPSPFYNYSPRIRHGRTSDHIC